MQSTKEHILGFPTLSEENYSVLSVTYWIEGLFLSKIIPNESIRYSFIRVSMRKSITVTRWIDTSGKNENSYEKFFTRDGYYVHRFSDYILFPPDFESSRFYRISLNITYRSTIRRIWARLILDQTNKLLIILSRENGAALM